MICPKCNSVLKLPINTIFNMENYGKPVKSITECCGQLVLACPKFTYSATAYTGKDTQDDWGREIKK